jgi:D-lyxose ketol-isomerase
MILGGNQMKRSQINQILQSAQAFFTEHQFHLPPWASWTEADWQGQGEACREVIDCQLGWDITDFGSGDFAQRGLTLFTVRNGKAGSSYGKTYAEKIMVVDDGQETPLHFHFQKAEDIINRGGGKLLLQLWNSEGQGEKADTPVSVSIDGVRRTLAAGGVVSLAPGESICLTRGLYHRFWGEGKVLVGEVSQVNDDFSDNRFYEAVGRFPSIDEDEAPWRLLVSDYAEKIR